MTSAQLAGVSVSYGARTVLDGVSFSVATGDRIALTGVNGSGKSTLMKIIAGEVEPDSGAVTLTRDMRISYLPQSGLDHSGCTLREEADKAFADMERVLERMRRIEVDLEGARADEDGEALLEEYGHLQDRVISSDYYHREQRVERVLSGLGFSQQELGKYTDEFSGGWQMRIALAKVLLESPDVLLLDEPTNYLDLEARYWLENFLSAFPGGLVVVSHDRYFLDVTVREVAEIYLGKLITKRGTFSEYERNRGEELAAIIKAYEQQQGEIERLEAFIRRFRAQASKARMVQERVRQLEKLQRIEIPPNLKKLHFIFPDPPHSGRSALRVKAVGKSYGSEVVLTDMDLDLERGERLVVVGPNGAGKSTLLRILARREEPDQGKVTYGSGVTCGYFSQECVDALDPDVSVSEAVEAVAETNQIPTLRGLLGAFLFRGDDIYKLVRVLSGGEAGRLALVQLLLHPCNLLILDEPTNHLDMTSKDVLLDALRSFSGTLLFVSHDRYFIDALATRVLDLSGDRPAIYYGDYSYYLWRLEQEAAGISTAPRAALRKAPGPRPPLPEPTTSGDLVPTAEDRPSGAPRTILIKGGSKVVREEEKRRKTELRRLEREEEEVLALMARLQEETEELERSMLQEDVYIDGEKMRSLRERLEVLAADQEDVTRKWERIDARRTLLVDTGGG